jgi:biotin-dependent carboxylase-like uncharacterized protein
MIKVLHPGIYSSIQDQGRLGFAKIGIPIAGSLDAFSAEIGNSLLMNRASDAVIEVTFGLAKLEFTSDTFICITGGNFSPKLNDDFLKMETVYKVQKGSVLTFGKRNYGARIYIAVQGGIQAETVLKSRSFSSQITSKSRLEKGDELSILPKKLHENRRFSRMKFFKEHYSSEELECFPGPEFDQLNERQKKKLLELFTISEDNNRVGYRLNEDIENDLPQILTSAVLPGTVQLTPSGKLIVLMRDCQVTGGYPRVLQLSEYAISRLSQKIAGEKIKLQLSE